MLAQKWPWGCWEDMGGEVRKASCPQEPSLKKFPGADKRQCWYEAGGTWVSGDKEGVLPLVLPPAAAWRLAEEDPPSPGLAVFIF